MIELFDLPQILRHNARFDLDKLHWLNGEYLREMSDDRFHELAVHALARAGIDTNKYPARLRQGRARYLQRQVRSSANCRPTRVSISRTKSMYDAEGGEEGFHAGKQTARGETARRLCEPRVFDADAIGATLAATAKELGVKAGVLVHPTRLACTGNPPGRACITCSP